MDYRLVGLIAILLKWAAFGFLITRWKGKKSMSISLHAASARSAYYFFVSIQFLAGVMFTLFMFQWFIPHLQLDGVFRVCFLFTMVCFFATIFIPETKGINVPLHRFFAFTLAGMLFIDVIYIVASCSLSFITQFVGGITLAYMAFCTISFLLFRKSKDHFLMQNFLTFQFFYLVSFQLFILSAAFLS